MLRAYVIDVHGVSRTIRPVKVVDKLWVVGYLKGSVIIRVRDEGLENCDTELECQQMLDRYAAEHGLKEAA